jgi:hypothetical protein
VNADDFQLKIRGALSRPPQKINDILFLTGAVRMFWDNGDYLVAMRMLDSSRPTPAARAYARDVFLRPLDSTQVL